MNRIPEEQRNVALIWPTTAAGRDWADPPQEPWLFGACVSAPRKRIDWRRRLLPLFERLAQRIVDGERNGLDADLDEAMTCRRFQIINEHCRPA